MRFSKKFYTVFISSLLATIFISSSFAEENCVQCGSKNISGMPSLDSKFLKVIARAAPPAPDPRDAGKNIPFENYQDGFCMSYTHIVRNQLGRLVSDMEDSTPFSVDAYLQKPGCTQEGYGGNVKSPMLHLTADDPNLREDFLQYIYKYYTMKRKDPSLWLAAINAKNTEGETVLDYFEHLIVKNKFRNEESKIAVDGIIAFACSKGAVYSKYNYKKCP
ncbi:MAG: hypothetical protein H7336_15050 [Bacteriovorax sp.]|nr:hypothetical protein [Bacteriovorax sp.]